MTIALNKRFYEEAMQMELNISHLYKLFSSLFEVDKEFWNQIAQEEETHASMIRLMEQSFINASKVMINDLNISRLRDINRRINAFISQVELEGIDRVTAFDVAVKLEHQVYELQFREIFQGLKIEGIKDLFAVLADKDLEHQNKLMRYVEEKLTES